MGLRQPSGGRSDGLKVKDAKDMDKGSGVEHFEEARLQPLRMPVCNASLRPQTHPATQLEADNEASLYRMNVCSCAPNDFVVTL